MKLCNFPFNVRLEIQCKVESNGYGDCFISLFTDRCGMKMKKNCELCSFYLSTSPTFRFLRVVYFTFTTATWSKYVFENTIWFVYFLYLYNVEYFQSCSCITFYLDVCHVQVDYEKLTSISQQHELTLTEQNNFYFPTILNIKSHF